MKPGLFNDLVISLWGAASYLNVVVVAILYHSNNRTDKIFRLLITLTYPLLKTSNFLNRS